MVNDIYIYWLVVSNILNDFPDIGNGKNHPN